MQDLIQQLENNLVHSHKENINVSSVNVAWHIDHSLKVLNGISQTALQSDPKDYKWSFNFIRILVFLKGGIPRGKGKAPDSVMPKGAITQEDLLVQFDKAKVAMEKIKTLSPKQHFKHPFFGVLNAKQTQKLLRIHTQHHLSIIKDIITKS
jgi:hypothetical protein